MVAFGLELSSMSGKHVEAIKTKSKETEKTYELCVKLAPDSNLQIYCSEEEKEYYSSGGYIINSDGALYKEDGKTPVLRPGKVDAYRFMTFYLEPTKDNFEDFFQKVVDPIWIDQSTDPEALALRSANQ